MGTPNLTILSTTVNQSVQDEASIWWVEALLADGPDFDTAETAVQFHTKWEAAAQYPRLAELQAAALRRVRDAIDAEIHRLQLGVNPTR